MKFALMMFPQGSLKGKSAPLRKVPEGLIVPPVPKDEFEKQYLPCAIKVNFRVSRCRPTNQRTP